MTEQLRRCREREMLVEHYAAGVRDLAACRSFATGQGEDRARHAHISAQLAIVFASQGITNEEKGNEIAFGYYRHGNVSHRHRELGPDFKVVKLYLSFWEWRCVELGTRIEL